MSGTHRDSPLASLRVAVSHPDTGRVDLPSLGALGHGSVSTVSTSRREGEKVAYQGNKLLYGLLRTFIGRTGRDGGSTVFCGGRQIVVGIELRQTFI